MGHGYARLSSVMAAPGLAGWVGLSLSTAGRVTGRQECGMNALV